jgi:hypothetical protein
MIGFKKAHRLNGGRKMNAILIVGWRPTAAAKRDSGRSERRRRMKAKNKSSKSISKKNSRG